MKIFVLACCGALMMSSAALAADRITISGCTSSGPEGCLFLKTVNVWGKSYPLFVAPPRPAPGRGVTVTGTLTNNPSMCFATPGIKVQRWHYNRLPCPLF
jgi:hypothetical protein